ncbi:hypothetical protein DEO72_LG3g503 [Vigna unguiculata]|uniref:Uncharacterized protein n=1 Tax=Vigna unguiculata TaxID=3917 RepID=A0A4D6LBN1_VIGUN|nr:hypothetical protein DEO72_LG3g503 [Vigna unguiculata]
MNYSLESVPLSCCAPLFGVESFASSFQWRKSDILTQASGFRLSESIKNLSQVLCELSLKRRALILSEKLSRLSERTQEYHCSPFRALA